MVTNIKVESLTHDELVDILSTALYGDNTFDVYINKSEDLCASEKAKVEANGGCYCYEDHLADQLLLGGRIVVEDCYARDEEEEEESKYTHYLTLADFLKGCSADYSDCKELLIDEEGDFFTAYNLFQTIVFGEVIYG